MKVNWNMKRFLNFRLIMMIMYNILELEIKFLLKNFITKIFNSGKYEN